MHKPSIQTKLTFTNSTKLCALPSTQIKILWFCFISFTVPETLKLQKPTVPQLGFGYISFYLKILLPHAVPITVWHIL